MIEDQGASGAILARIDERTASTAKRVETIEQKLDGVVYRREIEQFVPRAEVTSADRALSDRVDKLERWLTWGTMGLITTAGGMVMQLMHLKISG